MKHHRRKHYPPFKDKVAMEALKNGKTTAELPPALRFTRASYKCDREKWDEMLDIFYELHGWNKDTGLQTSQCLIELDMADVAKKLETAGKLIV